MQSLAFLWFELQMTKHYLNKLAFQDPGERLPSEHRARTRLGPASTGPIASIACLSVSQALR
jgi:hypothetical protein